MILVAATVPAFGTSDGNDSDLTSARTAHRGNLHSTGVTQLICRRQRRPLDLGICVGWAPPTIRDRRWWAVPTRRGRLTLTNDRSASWANCVTLDQMTK